MPSLEQSRGLDLSNYGPVDKAGTTPVGVTNMDNFQPGLTGFTRCPLPILSSSTGDTLRIFYQGARIPQNRLYNPTS